LRPHNCIMNNAYTTNPPPRSTFLRPGANANDNPGQLSSTKMTLLSQQHCIPLIF
jgi:hypothetical protein